MKDLSRLGRDLSKVIIVDNSPASYIFHPENAVPVQSWFDDMSDTELYDLIPFFEGLSKEEDVYTMLQNLRGRSRKQSAIGKHFSTCCPEFAANKVTCGRSASASLAPETHPRPDVEETTTILKRNTSHLQHVENQEKYPLQTVV